MFEWPCNRTQVLIIGVWYIGILFFAIYTYTYLNRPTNIAESAVNVQFSKFRLLFSLKLLGYAILFCFVGQSLIRFLYVYLL